MVSLGDICTINMGQSPDSESYNDVGNGIPFYQGNADFGERYPTPRVFCSHPIKIAHEGDILISVRAPIGAINYAKETCCIGRGLAALTVNTDKCLKDYLWYAITCKVDELNAKGTGSTFKAISKSVLSETQIQVPNLETQQGIVDSLIKVDKLIFLRKKQLQKLDDLVKSRFVEMFGDYDLSLQKTGWYKVSQIGTVVGGSTPKTNVPEYWNGEYRWISPAELEMDSGVILDSAKKITKAGIESCSLQELPIGTVILSSRAPIGKVAIAGNTFYCNQGFKNIICSTKVKPRFLYTLLLYNTEYLNSLGRGATFKEISKSIVEEIRIPVPPIKDQERFVQYNDQINGVRRCLKQGHAKLEQMKQALMQKYFG